MCLASLTHTRKSRARLPARNRSCLALQTTVVPLERMYELRWPEKKTRETPTVTEDETKTNIKQRS
jgi:hypothetical protein